jgi:hypothetical protein
MIDQFKSSLKKQVLGDSPCAATIGLLNKTIDDVAATRRELRAMLASQGPAIKNILEAMGSLERDLEQMVGGLVEEVAYIK